MNFLVPLLNAVSFLLIAGTFFVSAINGLASNLFGFIFTNAVSFFKLFGAVILLFLFGYLLPKKAEETYWIFSAIVVLLSPVGAVILKLTDKLTQDTIK